MISMIKFDDLKKYNFKIINHPTLTKFELLITKISISNDVDILKSIIEHKNY